MAQGQTIAAWKRWIGFTAQPRGQIVLADGAHVPGNVTIDIPSLGVDWYVANLHKWAFAPWSCGVLWVSPAQRGHLHAAVISWGLDNGLAAEFDLLLFESFLPDLAGHRRIEPAWVLGILDDFLGGVLAHRSPGTTLVLCSDHGNLEDTTTKTHTTNPVPLLAIGPGAARFRQATAITDVAPAILGLLVEEAAGGTP